MTDLQALPVEEQETITNGSAKQWIETSDEIALRDLIFNKEDIREQLVRVPEWGVQVLVRALTGNERADFISAVQKSNADLKTLYPDLVTMTARHPGTKHLIFKPSDRGTLMKKAGSAIERLALNAAELSGLSEEAMIDMRKN